MTKRSNLMTRILLAASLLVAAAFGAFSIYIDSLQRDGVAQSVSHNIESTGKQASQSIANWLNGRFMLTDSVAKAMEKSTDVASRSAILQNEVLADQFVSTYFGGEADGEMTQWPNLPLPAGYDPRQRGWYKQAVAAKAAVLTEPYVSASDKKLMITAAVPVNKDGKFVGVAASDFSLDTLVSAIKSVDAGPGGHAFLVNKAGKILIHPDAAFVNKTLADLFPTDTPSIGSQVAETAIGDKG